MSFNFDVVRYNVQHGGVPQKTPTMDSVFDRLFERFLYIIYIYVKATVPSGSLTGHLNLSGTFGPRLDVEKAVCLHQGMRHWVF